ncbi:DinB family protein [Reichenbachiella sp. MALMAid0571]|uniref:DinB family protein n=1 Tax=Reichenbachiella sp. MALMAid0571 TaxID=3143939 RepID=UPI0032DF12AA
MSKKIEQIKNVRLFILDQIKDLSPKQLNKIPEGFNNNVIWNLSHIISAQQSVCYVRANLPYVVEDKYFSSYQPSTKPEDFIDSSEIENIKELFITSIETFEKDHKEDLFANYTPWLAKPYGIKVSNIEDATDFLMFHEGLHAGYVIALKHLL